MTSTWSLLPGAMPVFFFMSRLNPLAMSSCVQLCFVSFACAVPWSTPPRVFQVGFDSEKVARPARRVGESINPQDGYLFLEPSR